MSASPGLIVCEGEPRLAILVRRFAPQLPIVEARSLALADDDLSERPASFVCIGSPWCDRPEVLLSLARWQQAFPNAALAVMRSGIQMRETRDADYLLAGAQLVLHDFRQVPLLIRLTQRHLAEAPKAELDWRGAIEAKLPWKPIAKVRAN